MKYTQDELSSIWEKRTERDEYGFWDVSGLANTSSLQAEMVTDTDVEQTFTLHTTPRYDDHSSDGAPVSYTRNEAAWGGWQRKD